MHWVYKLQAKYMSMQAMLLHSLECWSARSKLFTSMALFHYGFKSSHMSWSVYIIQIRSVYTSTLVGILTVSGFGTFPKM